MVEKLLVNIPEPFPKHELMYNVNLLQDAGFEIIEQYEEKPFMKFFDLGAAVYFAKQIPWEFPDFSVEKCFDRIKELQNEMNQNGSVTNMKHRFLIVARKK